MLTKEIIKANAILSELTDEQVLAIETLSHNDEETTMKSRIREIYCEMDNKIKSITGIERNGDEKTYLYLERAAKQVMDTAGDVMAHKAKVAELEKEKNRLERVLAEGAVDPELAKAHKAALAELKQTKEAFAKLEKEYNESVAGYDKALTDMHLDHDLELAITGVKIKSEIPELAAKTLLSQTVGKIKSAYHPSYEDDGNGNRRLVFHDDSGAPLNNPANKLSPYTASELLQKELHELGVLDEGRRQSGAGTTGGTTGGQVGSMGIDTSGARTRIEANEIATKALMAQGLTNGSEEFTQAMTKVWEENGISDLPEK